MLKRQAVAGHKTVKVTFALPLDDTDVGVSVVGDFNGWNPNTHPLRRRTNGTRSVAVELPTGSVHQFKYLDADGTWFCDDTADGHELNDFHQLNSIVRV